RIPSDGRNRLRRREPFDASTNFVHDGLRMRGYPIRRGAIVEVMDEETRRKVMHAAAAAPNRGRAIAEAAFEGIQAELNRERANALERAGRKLGDAIAVATAFLSALEQPPTPMDRERYAALRARAATARWEL